MGVYDLKAISFDKQSYEKLKTCQWDYIYSGFNWRMTPEGKEYWYTVYDQWKNTQTLNFNAMVKIEEMCKQFEEENEGVTRPKDRTKTASDGGSSEYFKLPKHATELRHLISYRSMSKSRGDIFKACYRLGEKEGVDIAYDLNKMKFFIDDLIEMYNRGEHI